MYIFTSDVANFISVRITKHYCQDSTSIRIWLFNSTVKCVIFLSLWLIITVTVKVISWGLWFLLIQLSAGFISVYFGKYCFFTSSQHRWPINALSKWLWVLLLTSIKTSERYIEDWFVFSNLWGYHQKSQTWTKTDNLSLFRFREI